MSTERDALRAALRSCRVEDAPNPLLNDYDIEHVAHMLTTSDWLAQVRAEARAAPHECEGQRQMGALVKVVAETPPPATVERIRAEARSAALTEAAEAIEVRVTEIGSRHVDSGSMAGTLMTWMDGLDDAATVVRALLDGAT